MKSKLFPLFAALIVSAISSNSARAGTNAPGLVTAPMNGSPSAGLPKPFGSPTFANLVSAEDKSSLLSEFKKALSTEEKALQHQDKSQAKELSAAQNSRMKNWRSQEKATRKVFFEVHQSGPERRQYVQDYLKRKEAFDLTIKNEQNAAKKASKDKADALKQSQRDRMVQFKAQLDQNQRPDPALWPKNN